jgi:hypothetical protein
MSLRTKATVGLIAVGIGYAALTLQSPSDDATRGNGAARINKDTVLLTVKFTDFDDGGPHTVAITWDSRMGLLGPPLDEGNDTASIPPYTRTIKAAPGAKVSAAAVPATREGSYRAFWTTECWLHQDGKLLSGHSHDGPNSGSQGCAVSGIAR